MQLKISTSIPTFKDLIFLNTIFKIFFLIINLLPDNFTYKLMVVHHMCKRLLPMHIHVTLFVGLLNGLCSAVLIWFNLMMFGCVCNSCVIVCLYQSIPFSRPFSLSFISSHFPHSVWVSINCYMQMLVNLVIPVRQHIWLDHKTDSYFNHAFTWCRWCQWINFMLVIVSPVLNKKASYRF